MSVIGTQGNTSADAVFAASEERSLVSGFFRGAPGYFVEVGAYDPVFQSQTYHLEVAGWNGLLIEPVPDLAENLSRNRRADVRQCACVAPEQASAGTVSLVERRGSSSLLSLGLPNGADKVIEVPALTLDTVLDEARVARVDFLSVDVEGAEPDVLRGLTLSRYRPELVLVDDRERFTETRKVLNYGGYRLIRRTGHNSWFVPKESSFRLSVRGRFQLLWTFGMGRLLRRTMRFGRARALFFRAGAQFAGQVG